MILVDRGVIVAAAVRNDVHHHSCVELIVGLHLAKRRLLLLLPATVIAKRWATPRVFRRPLKEVDRVRASLRSIAGDNVG